MRLRPGPAWWLAALLLMSGFVAASAAGQHSAPIKKKGLVDALGVGGLSASELADTIKRRGVDFRLTYDNEQDLREAGATPPVLEAVRKSYRRPAASPADRTNAANLVKSSRALLDAHDPNSALPVLTQALEIDPDNAAAYVLRGRVYLAKRQTKQAEADLNIALEIEPANAEAKRLLESAQNPGVLSGDPTGAGGIPAEGHQGFLGCRWRLQNGQGFVVGMLPAGGAARGGLLVGDIVLSVNGLSVKDFNDQYMTTGKLTPGAAVSMQVQRQGRLLTLQIVAVPRPNTGDEAINYYGQLIQQFPGNPDAYLYRGADYFQLKNFGAALEDLNAFLRLDPGEPSGYTLRAKVKAALGDQAGAAADQKEVTRLTPTAGAVAGGNVAAKNNAAGTPVLAEQWTLLQLNRHFRIRLTGGHILIQGVDVQATGEADESTDNKGRSSYKGKWRQQNANGTLSEWKLVLKKVSPERIEGTVYTLGFTGQAVTFEPAN